MKTPVRALGTILVANRGEIAVRVLRTVKSLGLVGAVVHHAADRDSPAVRAADKAQEITGRNADRGLPRWSPDHCCRARIGRRCDPSRLWLPFGECRLCPASGRSGPDLRGAVAGSHRADGRQGAGARVRGQAWFPVAPSAIEDDEPETFLKRAKAVGFPLLIKPAAGGGGKGMRIVRDAAVLEEEIARARSEGERYFGDGRLYVERYVENPRHIEVQVLGDAHGNVVHLFERECSVQRRFQKIIEESPSPALKPDRTRRDFRNGGATSPRPPATAMPAPSSSSTVAASSISSK